MGYGMPRFSKKNAFVLAFGWRSGSPPLHLPLGGAAVHRCDKGPVSMTASAAEGNCRAAREFFSKLFSPLRECIF